MITEYHPVGKVGEEVVEAQNHQKARKGICTQMEAICFPLQILTFLPLFHEFFGDQSSYRVSLFHTL